MAQIGESARSGEGPTYVLGISEAHNCTAALLRDGEIIAVASEERFTRFKNDTGYPKQAVEFVLSHAGIDSSQIDLVVLTYNNPYPHFGVAIDHVDPQHQANGTGSRRVTSLRKLIHGSAQLVYGVGSSNRVASRLLDFLEKNVYDCLYAPAVWPRLRRIQYGDLAAEIGIPESKIRSADHHLCHAVSALFFGPVPSSPVPTAPPTLTTDSVTKATAAK